MTETLLPDRDIEPERLEAQAEVSDRLHQLFVEEVRRLMAGLEGSARRFQAVWLSRVQDVARGQTDRVHAERASLQAAFDRRLGVLRRARRLVGLANGDANSEILNQEIAAFEQLGKRVFDLWQTSEDLEELAARDYPLPQARLQELARHHAPPPAWFEEESKPF